MAQILDLRHILTESTTDLRQPIALERQLLESSHATDDEVGLSMLQLLKVRCSAHSPATPAAEQQSMRNRQQPYLCLNLPNAALPCPSWTRSS